MELEIRPATPDDTAMLHQLVQLAFAEYEGLLEVLRALDETLEDAMQVIVAGGVLLAWDVSQASSTVRYELRPDCVYVGRLAVLPSHRRRRIGVALMKYIERLAPKMDRRRVELCTRQSMLGNLAFYSRLGYHVAKTEPNSQGSDTVWFTKELGLS